MSDARRTEILEGFAQTQTSLCGVVQSGHAMVDVGDYYSAFLAYTTLVADGGHIGLAFSAPTSMSKPNCKLRAWVGVCTNGAYQVQVVEGPVQSTVLAASITPVNLNRKSANASGATVQGCNWNTNTTSVLLADSHAGNFEQQQITLNTNTSYGVKVINLSGGNAYMTVGICWYQQA